MFSEDGLRATLSAVDRSSGGRSSSCDNYSELPTLGAVVRIDEAICTGILKRLRRCFNLLARSRCALSYSPSRGVTSSLFHVLSGVYRRTNRRRSTRGLVRALLGEYSPPTHLPLFSGHFRGCTSTLVRYSTIRFAPVGLR